MRGMLLVAIALLVAAPAAYGQAGVSYQVPADNPFVGRPGAAPEVYSLGLRNPYRFSFDRATSDLLIGDVGGGFREEIDWASVQSARGANFGWACREGKVAGPRPDECPVPNAVEPVFDYAQAGPRAVTGGFVVRDPTLTGLVGRYLYADYYAGQINSLALNFAAPDNKSTGVTIPNLPSFGEDAAGRLYAVTQFPGQLHRLVSAGPGTLSAQALGGTWADDPVAIGTVPGDPARLLVAEQSGNVRLVVDGSVLPTPFLDVKPFGLSAGGERGLLSVAAAPDYAASGKVYVYYTDSAGDIRLDEVRRSAGDPNRADPASRRTLLTIPHSSASNHNGGQLHFGPDGCLWITTGDGGGQNNQFNNAQNVGTLLGKVLRINPNPPGVGGSACGGTAPPVVQPPRQPVPPVNPPPVLRTSVKGRQRVLRLGGVIVYARCVNEPCTLAASGRLRVGKRRFGMRPATRKAKAGQRVRLKVQLTKRSRRVLRKALRRGRRPTVRIAVKATDAGGKVTLARKTVRVRR